MDAQSFLHSTKPFIRYKFYIDIKNNPQLLEQITENIIALSGKIESFLSKNINYVVTNKPKHEWPQKPQEEACPVSPNTNNMNNPKLNASSFSRGGMLLAKSAQLNMQKTTVDVLEQARALKVKILLATDVMNFCKKHSLKHGKRGANDSDINNTMQKLVPPFIKVMDNSNKYKANFKEFCEWPEVNFSYIPELCPFFKRRKQSPQMPAHISQSFKSNTLMNQQGVRFNDKCTVLTTPTIAGTTVGAAAPFFKSTTTPTPNNNGHAKKRIFCEICHKDFDDFEKHLEDLQHKDFMRNPDNFSDLVKVSESVSLYIMDRKRCKKLNFDENYKTNLEESKSSLQSKIFVPLHKLLDDGKTNADFIDNFK